MDPTERCTPGAWKPSKCGGGEEWKKYKSLKDKNTYEEVKKLLEKKDHFPSGRERRTGLVIIIMRTPGLVKDVIERVGWKGRDQEGNDECSMT